MCLIPEYKYKYINRDSSRISVLDAYTLRENIVKTIYAFVNKIHILRIFLYNKIITNTM